MRYDIAIIGSGPAGISAAITAKNRNKSILLFGKRELSVKLQKAHQINNYPGFYGKRGEEIATAFRKHMEQMGIELTESTVTNIYPMGDYFSILTRDQIMYEAGAVILATGVEFGHKIPGEEEFLGKGVSYCATCDAMFYRGKNVAVIGFSEEAKEEAKFLSEVAGTVYYVEGEKALSIRGEELVTQLVTKDGELSVDGVFIIRASMPPAQLLPGIELEGEFLKVDRAMKTSVKGCFAAGDLTGAPFQYVKAAGEGNVAALSAVNYLGNINSKES